KLHLKEKRCFKKANSDDILDINVDEFTAFGHPEEVEYMMGRLGRVSLSACVYRWNIFLMHVLSPTAREGPEWVCVEKDQFVNDCVKDDDGIPNPQELLSWRVPYNEGIGQEEGSLHLIKEMDLNNDKKLLKNRDFFLNSEARDYGSQLEDERFHHEEL
ncbi:Reticulocalbin-2, partial [Calypte anna]